MGIKDDLMKSLVKSGYAKLKNNKVWDIAERRFLYMTPELAKGFLALRKFDIYKRQIINRETALIHAHAKMLSKNIGKGPFNLVDIFCGDGKKAIEFVRALGDKVKIRYCPVNVNKYLTNLAVKNMKKAGFKNIISYNPRICDCNGREFRELEVSLKDKVFNRNVILLLGSVVASFEINDYLFEASKGMGKKDMLIIGNGVRKGDRLVNIKNYKHKGFDDWFFNLMNEIGFKRKDLIFDAKFNGVRVEMFYKLRRNVTIEHKNNKMDFKKGDEILTFFLYKYYAKELDEICDRYFKKNKIVLDKDEEHALAICMK